MAVKLATLSTLEQLEQEMAAAGRAREEQALREVLNAVRRPPNGYVTTGAAAERLGISIPTVKDWIRRGTLDGGPVGGRWLVDEGSVERVLRIRRILREMDEEGNPTDEEIRELYSRRRAPADS